MKKKLVTIAAIACLSVSIIGCGPKNDSSNPETATQSPAANITGKVPDSVKEAAKLVTLGEYKGLKLELAEVTKDQINEYIDKNLIAKKVTYKKKEGTVKDGDLVNINFVGKKDGTAFDNGTDDTEEGTNLLIGSSSFIKGFEEGLIGVKTGETKDLNLTFPTNYDVQELSGEEVVFTVTVNYICGDEIKPELTDEFIAANTEYKTVEEYRTIVKDTLNADAKKRAEDNIWVKAVESAKVSEYPQEDIDTTLKNLMEYYKQMAVYYGQDLETVLKNVKTTEKTFNEDMLNTAQKSVAAKLVSLAIVDTENIVVTDEVYTKKANEYINTYGYQSIEELEGALSKEDLTVQMYMDLGRQFVIDNAVS